MASLRQVAQLAGVSAMTASLALRENADLRRMSAETRQRVLSAARELRYFPNARARALRLGRTNVIGLYAGHGFINVRSPFFTEIVSGLQEGCEAVKKDLLLHGTFHSASSSRVLDELLDGRIDGLVVNMPATDGLAENLAASDLPVVAVADSLPRVPSIVVDDAQGATRILRHLDGRGHRRALFVMSDTRPCSALRRRDGFLEAARGSDLCAGVWHLEDGGQRDLLLQASAAGVTALACWNDETACGLLAAAGDLGMSVPSEIAITGFDGCASSHSHAGRLTTIVAPWAEAGRLAVVALDRLLSGESVPMEQVLPVDFLLGATS